MSRLAIIASHVIQYQDPFFRKLAAVPDLDVIVFFCSREGASVYRDVDMQTSLRWDLDLLQGYRHRFLRNVGWGHGFFRLVNPGIVSAIVRGRFDAVLFMTGWAWATAWLGFAACRIARVPIFMYGDSSFVPEEQSLRARIRSRVMRALFERTSAFMISGAWNADYYDVSQSRSAEDLSDLRSRTNGAWAGSALTGVVGAGLVGAGLFTVKW